MIHVFVLQNGRLKPLPIDSRADLENLAPVCYLRRRGWL